MQLLNVLQQTMLCSALIASQQRVFRHAVRAGIAQDGELSEWVRDERKLLSCRIRGTLRGTESRFLPERIFH